MVIFVNNFRTDAKRYFQGRLGLALIEEEDSPRRLPSITFDHGGETVTRGIFEIRFRDSAGQVTCSLLVRTLSAESEEVLTETILRTPPLLVRFKAIVVKQGKETNCEVVAQVFDDCRVEFGCVTGGFPTEIEPWPDQPA